MLRGSALRLCLSAVSLALGAACTDSSSTANGETGNTYFSLEAYFNQEIKRLQQHLPLVNKTVAKNGEAEEHAIPIENWRNELALFIDSDINKPAWRGSYQVDSSATSLSYTSLDPDLRTQSVTIEKDESGAVKHIGIVNRVHNMLYQTEEQLDYYPDSLYRITKQQNVRVIGESHYEVSGLF